ncbi:hypothetical protein HEP74_00120 [Xanthomonas sp. SS]|uniref:hypothetical protein n=1 Tax=Xanthomonas sp. SS TaxID=2724122 RepID=UPI00163964FD|nr:hypothetical protein [Xanthomonas sp. SS]QNH15007.1 hypothetical protein HEP74_00120 [Xanthomonas sp. SS]
MLLYTSRFQRALHRALRAAVAMHRADILCQLLAAHGVRAFGKALSGFPARVLADALSLLPGEDRIRVLVRLSRSARRRLRQPGPAMAAVPGWRQRALGWWSDSAAALRRAIATHLPHHARSLSPDISAGIAMTHPLRHRSPR